MELPIPDQKNEILLYEADQPAGLPEQWSDRNGDRTVRNVVSPTITPVLPDPAQTNGAAAIILPGGGFRLLAIDHEGFNAARFLAGHGVAAFALKYRTAATHREQLPGPGPGGPGKSERGAADKRPLRLPAEAAEGLKDAWTALTLVRSRAAEWNVDPSRIGALGFSAGAMLALELALGEEKAARPAFAGVIYGPLSARDVPANAPPMFTALAADDSIMIPRGFDLIQNYLDADKPVEFHLFENGGHAFGMKQQGATSDLWAEQFLAWMKDRGLLEPAAR